MSVQAMGWVLETKIGDTTRKMVLLGMANHAHADGTCAWSGVERLAEYVECSPRTVRRHLTDLIAEGFIREGDQGLVAHIRGDRRPIVYDLAMSEAVRMEWRAEHAAGSSRRDVFAEAGRAGAAVANGRAAKMAGRDLDDSERGDESRPAMDDIDDLPSVTERPAADGRRTVLEPSLEPSDSSLRSESAASAVVDALAEQPDLPLDGIPAAADTKGVRTSQTAEGSKAAKPVDPIDAAAQVIVKAFHAWYEQRHNGPIVGSSRAYWGLVRNIVGEGLRRGYTEAEVKLALTACGERGIAFPSISQWQQALSEVRSGRSLTGRQAPANRHLDGDQASRDHRAKVEAAWGATG